MVARIDLNDVRLLLKVVEHGSYTAAARATGVPKSTVSQRVARLEATVGTALLRRTSRSCCLTEAGSQILPHAQAIEDIARRIESSVTDHGSGLQGTLRLSSSQPISQFALSQIMPKFLDLHERVTIRMEASNRVVDLIGEGFDMTVRCHTSGLKDSSLIQRVVARCSWALAASPAWLSTNGVPMQPSDILSGQTLCFSNTSDCEGWTLRCKGRTEVVATPPRMISDDEIALRTSAIVDGGITYLPGYLLRPSFALNELIRILPDWETQVSTISVITPPKAQSSRLIAAFSDFLAVELPTIMQE